MNVAPLLGLRDVLDTAAHNAAHASAMTQAVHMLDAMPADATVVARIYLPPGGRRDEVWIALPVSVAEIRERLNLEVERQLSRTLAGLDKVTDALRDAGVEPAGGE